MNERFAMLPTPIAGVILAQRQPVNDARGWFERVFCADEFSVLGLKDPVMQINQSFTAVAGAVRGMHFQHSPSAEWKVISCVEGEVFDVVVDLRQGSPTFLRWHGEALSASNHRSMIVPPGVAHGFQTQTDHCRMLYLHSQPFNPDREAGISAIDPALKIVWPRPITLMSDRDKTLPVISPGFGGFVP